MKYPTKKPAAVLRQAFLLDNNFAILLTPCPLKGVIVSTSE
jgi:hypothetical protein